MSDRARTTPTTAATSAATSAPRPLAFTPLELAGAAAVVVIWGMNFLVVKVGLRDFTPLQLGVARFALALLPLALLVRPPRLPAGWVIAYGLLQGFGQFACLFLALKLGMTTVLASVLVQTQLFVTALIGALALREPVGRPLKRGMVFAAMGLACFAISVVRSGGGEGVTVAGLLLTLSASSMWAGSNVVVRKLQRDGRRYDPLALVVWSAAVSLPAFAAASLVLDGIEAQARWREASLAGWLAVVYLGWGANVLAYWLWARLLTRHPANRVAPFGLGMPLVGLLAGVGLLGEPVGPWQWAGAVLVMSALVFVVRGERPPRA